ncbi:MAG: sigma-70 family RNA polymerase sigma factor [Planctomycetota bacterium]|nr:sigma-70 family RNA polymerase sigma factor [Planctomycetota bacterium]
MTDQESAEIPDQDKPEQDPADKVSEESAQPDSESSSVDLLKKFTDGDTVAFERLIEREFPPLRRGIEARLGPDIRRRIDPTDVFQQAALDVYRLRDDFDNRGLPAFRAWLKKIMLNNVNRLIEKELAQKRDPRREKRRAMEAGRSRSLDPLGNLSASISSPSAGLRREEDLELLKRCLDMLSDDDRQLLLWIHSEGKEYVEVARLLAINVDATRRRHSRAMARLKEFADAMRKPDEGYRGNGPVDRESPDPGS